jgi:hypothetical protein
MRKFALLIMALLLPLASAAPVLLPDGVPLSVSDPGLGLQVFAFPGSQWEVWFNDNWGNDRPGHNGDFDFNDAVAGVTFGPLGVGTFIGSSASDFNVLKIDGIALSKNNPGPKTFHYVPGSEIIVAMVDVTTGRHYFSGPASRNPDGVVHAWTEQTGVPEPGTLYAILMGCGLLAFGCLKSGRR